MKKTERIVRKFRLVAKGNSIRIYFTFKNEERFIGYYHGRFEASDEEILRDLTGSIGDYTSIIMSWNSSRK